MNEVVKTLIYVGTACFFGIVAMWMRPSDSEFSIDDIERQVNSPLFPQFTDPGEASSLEVVKVDEVMGRLERFKVARDATTGQWTIPSHNGYPADAEDQMKTTSVVFIDLPIIGIASTVSEEHALFGVVQPDERTAETAEGVGILVSIEDKSGESLAQLIVGKSVRGTENQRFVRRPGQDVVYVVAIDPESFSTRFEDWIDRDLLQLNAFDVESIRLEDYTVGGVVRNNELVPDQQQRMEADLRWDSTGGKWSLERLVTFQGRQPVEEQLGDDEELNTTKLNDLKEAVAAMEIVNVFRKPTGLGANLRTDESFMQDMESLQSLVEKGFYPMRRGPGSDFELRAANGEVRVGTTEGVEYILRFGNTAGTQQDDPDKMNRFMFVTARFDESKFPMPDRPTLPSAGSAPATEPETPASEDAPADTADDATPATESDATPDDTAAEEQPAPGEAVSSEPGSSDSAANESDAEVPAADDAPDNSSANDGDETLVDDNCAPWQEDEGDASGSDADETVAQEPAAAPSDDRAEGSGASGGEELEDEETASLRQQMEAEYQRQLDAREEKIQNGRERVRELNDRFADWYYVISEDYFKRIHLSRADLVRPKGSGAAATPGGFGLPEGLNLPGDLNLPGLPDLDLNDFNLDESGASDADSPGANSDSPGADTETGEAAELELEAANLNAPE